MIKKPQLNLTIRRMLIALIAMGVTGTVCLAVIGLLSNRQIMESQKRLTEIASPLDEGARQVRMAATALAIRGNRIKEARDMAEIDQIITAERLKEMFGQGMNRLTKVAQKTEVTENAGDLPERIKSLEKIYTEILERDAEMLGSARKSIRLKADILRQIQTLDEIGESMRKNAMLLSEKIREQETGQTRKSITDLRLNIVSLVSSARQVLLARDTDKITLIRNKMIKDLNKIQVALNRLTEAGEEPDTLQIMTEDFGAMKEIPEVAVMQSAYLEEQKNRDLRDSALRLLSDSLTATLKEIQAASDNVREMAEKRAARVRETIGTLTVGFTLLAVACMIITGLLIIRRIILPINKAVSFAETIAQGDLTAEIQKEYNDEVGNLVSKLGEMAHNLNALISQVQRSGIQVTSSATELSATSKQQETVMKTQLESTNYVVRSVAEISDVSEDLVDTMKKVATMSDQTADFASSGQTDLSQMEEAMRHMENASKSISGKLEAINEKAANITSVVTTITKVADQTNLLSLNAAIEAEKAGEYGRGFTVVAREIRRLADQTAVATLDIDQMVQEMQSAVSAGVMEMDAFITEVQRSAENVGKISMQLSRIIEQVQALSPSFEGVNESMQFQAEKAQQINNSMVSLSEEMQQTVDSLRESFMAIDQLNDAAGGLQDEVSRFRVM